MRVTAAILRWISEHSDVSCKGRDPPAFRWGQILKLRSLAVDDLSRVVAEIEADALARRAGLEPRRVKRAFQRLLDEGWLAPSFPRHTALDQALRFMTPADALALFEHADLAVLARRVALFEYLTDAFTPFYTLNELANLMRRFIDHLKRNRDHLLKTGHPQTSFSASPFLDWHLTRLCVTKLPLTVQAGRPAHRQAFAETSGEATRNDLGDVVYTYTWPDRTPEFLFDPDTQNVGDYRLLTLPGFAWGPDGPLSRSTNEPLHECAYEDAALAPGLELSGAARLRNLRGRLLDARLALLEKLQLAAEGRRADQLEEECMAVLAGAFTYDEAEFLLRMDAIYEELHAGNEIMWTPLREEAFHSSGLKDLFGVVAHVEKEIQIGSMHTTREGLHRCIGSDRVSYYQVVGHPQQAAVDEALARFETLEEKEKAFMVQYEDWISHALETRFSEEVALLLKVPRSHAGACRLMLASLADFVKTHVETTGQLPSLALASPTPTPVEAANVFRLEGDMWTVRYENQESHFTDLTGFRYLHHLLAQPHQSISALALYTVGQGTAGEAGHDIYRELSEEELAGENLSVIGGGHLDYVRDHGQQRELLRHADDLRDDIARAREFNDPARVEILSQELDFILNELTKSTGLAGNPRPMTDRDASVRSTVSQAVSRALKHIKKEIPALEEHLKASISMGYQCIYAPQSRVDWDLRGL